MSRFGEVRRSHYADASGKPVCAPVLEGPHACVSDPVLVNCAHCKRWLKGYKGPGCIATVESDEGVPSYSMQRIRVTRAKRCDRKATKKIGHLDLCTVHARMAREGFVDELGGVSSSSDIANARKYPRNFPGGFNNWHTKYPEKDD